MLAALRGYEFLLLPLALGLMIPAAVIPWIGVNFLGVHQFSPVDIMMRAYSNWVSSASNENPDVINLLSSYRGSFYLSIFSLAAFVSSISMLVAAAVMRSQRPWIGVAAGVLAIAAAAGWVLAVESLQNGFAAQAASTGGIIGEEFKGHEQTLADSMIRLGTGHFFVAGAGALAILSFMSTKILRKESVAVKPAD